MFPGTERWKAHLKTSPQCKDKHYPCNHCHSRFCGFDALALVKYFYSSNTCKSKHASFLAGTIGKLPPSTADGTLSTQQKKDCNNYSLHWHPMEQQQIFVLNLKTPLKKECLD